MKSNIFTTLSALVVTSVVITDDSVVSNFSELQFTKNSISSSIFIIVNIQIVKQFLIGVNLIIFLVYSLTLFIIVSFSFSQKSTDYLLVQVLVIGVFVSQAIVQIYWKKTKVKHLYCVDNSFEYSKQEINSPLNFYNIKAQNLVSKCEDIQLLIQNFTQSPLKKNHSLLQKALLQINDIKTSLARKDLQSIDQSQLDDYQKEYFTSNGYINKQIKHKLKRGKTIQQMLLKSSTLAYTQIETAMSGIGKQWNFDIWLIHSSTGQSLQIVAQYILDHWSIQQQYNISQNSIKNYFQSLQSHYLNNPYHNACHAADVLISFVFFLSRGFLAHTLQSLDVYACVIASLGHDVCHPGLNNKYLINSQDPLAVRYNDNSVLQNMHAAKTFELMESPQNNILANLHRQEWIQIRKLIVDMILATDMSKHFQLLGTFRVRAVTLKDIDMGKFEDKSTVLSVGMKCADVGHSAKNLNLHVKWSYLICEEFFNQGDLEKANGIPVSMFCDREDANMPKNQVGFLTAICLPLYEVWNTYIQSEEIGEKCLEQLKSNLVYWQEQMLKRSMTYSSSQQMSRKQSKNKTVI